MADEFTQRTQELEGGLDQLQSRSNALAVAPPTPLEPATTGPVTAEIYTPAPPPVIAPVAAPVEEPVAPPTWDEVSNDPDFQSQSPNEKAASFARWHDAAFNFASTLPDWKDHEAEFNTTAAEEQTRLLKEARAQSLDEARARVAHEAILDKPFTTPDAERATLKELGQDIAGAYLRQQRGAEDQSASDDGWDFSKGSLVYDAVKSGLSSAAQTGLGLVKGVVRYVTPPIPTDKDQVGYDSMVKIHNGFKNFGDFVNTWREEIPKGLGINPETTGAKVGEFAGGLAPYLLALPAAVIAHVGGAYGDTLDKTGDQTKATTAAALAGVTDLLFMELAKYTSGLGKGITDPAKRWATRIAAGTGGNISFQQLVKAGHAAVEAPADQRYEAFKTALSDMNWTDAGIQAAFAIHATKHAEAAMVKPASPIAQADAALETAAAAAEPVAPATAAAARAVAAVKPPAEATAPTVGTDLVLGHNVDAEGKPVPYAEIPDSVPIEELQRAKDNLPPASPDGTSETDVSNRYFHQALDEAIARKQTEFAPKGLEDDDPLSLVAEEPEVRPSHERIAEAQRELAAARQANDVEGERAATDKLNAVATELIGQQTAARAESQTSNPELTEMGQRNGAQYEGPESNGNHSFTLLDEGKETTFQMPAGFTEADLQAKIEAKRAEFAPATLTGDARPQFTRRTPEEQKAKEDEGTQFIREEVARTGRVPKLAYIRGRVGNNADIARALHEELTAGVAEAHPPEAVPQGAEITTVKHPLTGDELPSVVEAPDAAGVRRTRPQFVNDPDILGQMIDQGMISGDKSNRLYIPDELVDADQVNPSIAQHMKYDREAQQYYVDGVQTRHGFVDAPDQFTAGERQSQQFTGRAQKEVSLPPEKLSALNEALRNELDSRGAEADAIAFEADAEAADADRVETDRGSKSQGVGDPLVQLENVNVLDELGLLRKKGETPSANPVQDALDFIANDSRSPEWMRLVAQVARKAAFDFFGVKVILKSTPGGKWAGRFSHTTKALMLNAGVRHDGGIRSSFMHEMFHSVLDGKLEPNAPRNALEQRAYDLLNRLHEDVLTRVFMENNDGRMPNDFAERDAFQDAQLRPGAKGNLGRLYYGLSNIREFVMETLTNPNFQRMLSTLETRAPAAERLLFRKIIDTVKNAAKTLFTGKEVKVTSALDNALNHALELLQQGPTAAGRFDVITQNVRPASLTAEGRAQLADANARAQQRAERNQSAREETGLSDEELTNEISGEETTAAPTVLDRVRGDGWVTPDGKFIPIEERDNAAAFRVAGAQAPIFGGHEQAAFDYVQSVPKLAREFEQRAEELGYQHINEMGVGDIKDFMEEHGFLRVMHDGRNVFFTGDPRRNPEGAQLLTEHAIDTERTLAHDREQSGPNSLDTIYRPPTHAGAEESLALPAEESTEERPAEVRYSRRAAGRRELSIGTGATRAQLEGVSRLIDSDTEAPEAVKGALKEQVSTAARQQDPVLVDRVLFGGKNVKDTGREIIVAGANSAENIPKIIAQQKANRVALAFGSAKKVTKEMALDRSAMPFVIEAGGDVEELRRDLDRVANSKDLGKQYSLLHPFTPSRESLSKTYTRVIEHAIENFDRLDKLKDSHLEVMKEQLQREQTYGIDTPELENYVTRVLEAPDATETVIAGSNGQGGTRYFSKSRSFEKLADAIEAGFRPATTDIVDLDAHRIQASERLIQQKILHESLKAVHAPDGRPIISTREPRETLYHGSQEAVPRGYRMVSTGAAPLIVHQDYVPLFNSLYGQRGMSALTKWAGFMKKNTLVFDTFHVGRVAMKEAAYSKGGQRFGYGKGLSILEYSPKDLDRAVEVGDITPQMRDYAQENNGDAQDLIHNGLNVAKMADNLNAEHAKSVSFIHGFNTWVFSKLSRGAILQSALENLKRNTARFPELSREEVLRKTSKEMNEVFGNLQKQSIFKDPKYQDALRSLFLAPQWAESQLKAELRGYGQILKAPVDLARGKARLGVVAQGQITSVLGMFAAMQVASYLFNGHSTFGNKKRDWFNLHIPGGRAGFEFNPLEIGGEYAFMANRYFNQHMKPADIAKRILFNKLSPVARGGTEYLLNQDFTGKAFANQTDRARAAAIDALVPVPPAVGAFIEKDPRQTIGFRVARRPGARIQQAIQSAGFKISAALTPRGEIFALAQPYRADKGYGDTAPPQYTELRRALDNDQPDNVASELQLLASRGKTEKQIKQAVGLTANGIAAEKFTADATREKLFKAALTPEQREIYNQAQEDHRANARRLATELTKLKTSDKDFVQKLILNARKPTAQDFQ